MNTILASLVILGEVHLKVCPVSPSISLIGGNPPRPCCVAPYAPTSHHVSLLSLTWHCTLQPILVHHWIPCATHVPSCIVLYPARLIVSGSPILYTMQCESLNENKPTTLNNHAYPCSFIGHHSSLHSSIQQWMLVSKIGYVCIRSHCSS